MKKKVKSLTRERKGRVEVLLDLDDFFILYRIGWYHLGNRGLLSTSLSLEELTRFMNLSSRSMGQHIIRLERHGFIEIFKLKDDWRTKYIMITQKGRAIVEALIESKDVQELYEEHWGRK